MKYEWEKECKEIEKALYQKTKNEMQSYFDTYKEIEKYLKENNIEYKNILITKKKEKKKMALGLGAATAIAGTAGAAGGIYGASKSASSAKKLMQMQIAWERERAQNAHQWA